MTKAKNPKSYIAPHDVYTAGTYTPAGEVFVTDAEPGEAWVSKTPAEAHAIDASTDPIPGGPALEELDISALKAVAVTKKVNVSGMSTKKELIAAIKAADEPRL